jgi:hypothetical protein
VIDVAEFTAISAWARAHGLSIHEAEAFALSVLLASAYHQLPREDPAEGADDVWAALVVVQQALMARPTRRGRQQATPPPSMERGPSLERKGTRGGPMAELPRVDPVHPAGGPRPHAR